MTKSAERARPTGGTMTDFHALKRPVLATQWQATFSRPLSPGINQPLAAQLLRFHQQEITLGGLPADVEAYLASLLPKRRGLALQAAAMPLRRLKPGTRLLRAWHGVTHTVTVADPGFVYRGKTYGSLSVVAREITGTPWSGPVFFGLKKAESADRSA